MLEAFPYTADGEPTSYTLSGTLPEGIVFSPASGSLSGTPTVVTSLTTYEVTAKNAIGSTKGSFQMSVAPGPIAPANLTYTNAAPAYVVGVAIAENVATLDGTAPFSFTVSPALPAGLALNTTTGSITGTPASTQTETLYTVTATNTLAQTSTTLLISITATLTAPNITGYTLSPANYTRNQTIATNSPVLAGGTPASFAIAPPLPAGLAFSTSNGRITGTPTADSASAAYTITATNTAGSDTFDLTISVTGPIAPTITYPAVPVYHAPGTRIVITPTVNAATGVTYAVSPSLPEGLVLNTSTGVISGPPSVVAALAPYTVTATNTEGSDDAQVSIQIDAAVTPASASVAVNRGSLGAGFSPTTVSITCGQSVDWTMGGDAGSVDWIHSVKAESPADAWIEKTFSANGTSGNANGSVIRLGFNQAGTFQYGSSHDSSSATVTVTGPCL